MASHARVAELVDAHDSKSCSARSGGSIPSTGTTSAVDDYDGLAITKAALRLAPLVFVRPDEFRHAEWAEFDLAAAEWRIPSAKMKMRRAHRVPLSRQALDVLRDLQPISGGARFLFPSV